MTEPTDAQREQARGLCAYTVRGERVTDPNWGHLSTCVYCDEIAAALAAAEERGERREREACAALADAAARRVVEVSVRTPGGVVLAGQPALQLSQPELILIAAVAKRIAGDIRARGSASSPGEQKPREDRKEGNDAEAG